MHSTQLPVSAEEKLSEGETFIEEYLTEIGFKFASQYKISGLKNDTKSYRVSDFYLPKYKVHVEFLGKWNSAEHRERYKEKMRVYAANNIPCVYLYPDNLGILEQCLDFRIKRTLKQHNMRRELRRFLNDLYWNDKSESIIAVIMMTFLVLLIFFAPLDFYDFVLWTWACSIIALVGNYCTFLWKTAKRRYKEVSGQIDWDAE